MKDLAGIGEAVKGLAKLLDTIKSYCVWAREPARFDRMLQSISQNKITPGLIEYKTPNVELKIKAVSPDEPSTIDLIEYQNAVLTEKSALFVKEQYNRDRIIVNAAKKLNHSEGISNDQVDEDWLANFFEHAKYANSDYMQILWGRILADEVVKPGSYSIRALDALRNLKKTDAENFTKICSLLLANVNKSLQFVLNDADYLLREKSLSQRDLSYLEEIGLIRQSSLAEIPIGILSNDNLAAFTHADKKIFFIEAENMRQKLMELNYFYLTRLGIELAHLVNPNDTVSEKYLTIVAQKFYQILNKKHPAGIIYVADVTSFEDSGIRYTSKVKLEINDAQ